MHWLREILFGCTLNTILTEHSRKHTCEQEESSSRHSDAGLGGWVVISHLSALHAHHADDDADKAQQYWHYHEGPACLDVDWIKIKKGGGRDRREEHRMVNDSE